MVNYIFYGLVTSVTGFGYSLLLFYLGFQEIDKIRSFWYVGLFVFVIYIIGLMLSIRESKKEYHEDSRKFTYGSVFKVGALTSLFLAIGNSIFAYIHMAFINTGLADILLQLQIENASKEAGSPEELEAMEAFFSKVYQPPILAFSELFNAVIFGILITLIIGIFMRDKNKVDPLIME